MAEAEEPKDIQTAQTPEGEGLPATPPEDSDPATDKAIDDIVRKEGDEELKAQDALAFKATVMKLSPWEKFKNFQAGWWGDPNKKWGTIITTCVIVVAVFAVPFTRYNMLGLFVRAKVTIQALDSKSGAPISGVHVQVGSEQAETNAEGKAVLTVHTGTKRVQVSKKYYAGTSQSELVTLSPNSNVYKLKMVALGRQVKVKVVDKISGKAVEDAEITAGGATAKTDKNGLATVVIPSGSSTQVASISLVGYNTANVTLDANGDLTKNTLSVTPAGNLYFLSNLSGTIDVVKTDLDGTNRHMVLAGTGNEDPHSTSLLASRDWKYLALLSKRSGNNASIYLIDTTNNDKLTTIDEGDVTFSLVGWSGDQFIYSVDRSLSVPDWQAGQYALKSFDPTTGHTLLLDQTQASGSSSQDWVGQSFGQFYLMGTKVVYTKGWNSSWSDSPQLNSKQAELDSIGADGSGHQVVKTFSVGSGTQTSSVFVQATLYVPDELYLDYSQGSSGDQFFEYSNGKVTQNTSLTTNDFYQTPYPTFLLSPSGNNTFWAEQRDGKNTLFTGDQSADNKKQIASLSDYSPYGWFTDNYLLVSKNSSELYVMPVGGGNALKITDYYKPPINYNGYGGGYGGL